MLDVLRPSVVSIDEDNFMETVGAKTEEEMWLVDFYAPWCRPCQELAPEWRKLAKVCGSRVGHVSRMCHVGVTCQVFVTLHVWVMCHVWFMCHVWVTCHVLVTCQV